MAIVTKDVLIEKLNKIIGEDTSDESLSLLEDVSDTFDSLSDGENWRARYEENDSEWRKKYKERFEQPQEERKKETLEQREEEKTTFEELFKY